jgi:hypothetical protein
MQLKIQIPIYWRTEYADHTDIARTNSMDTSVYSPCSLCDPCENIFLAKMYFNTRHDRLVFDEFAHQHFTLSVE